MGKSWIVLQKPISNYADQEGVCYNYPTGIPNGRRIKTGDYLVCSLTKKFAKEGKRLFGIGRVESITMPLSQVVNKIIFDCNVGQ